MPKKPIKISDRKRVRVTVAKAFGPDPLGFVAATVAKAMARRTAAVPEPTIEDMHIADQTARAVRDKQRLPGKRRRRKSSQRDRLQKAIDKRLREVGTLKRALALLDATPSKTKARATRAAVAAKINAPL